MKIKLSELIKAVDYLRYYNRDLLDDSSIDVSMLEESISDGVLQSVLTFTVNSVDYSNKEVNRTVELYPASECKEPRIIEISTRNLKDS